VNQDALNLEPEILMPAASPTALLAALEREVVGAPLCTCHAVAEVLLPQHVCFRILSEYTARPGEGTAGKRFIAVPTESLWRRSQGDPVDVEAVDPSDSLAGTDERRQVTFIDPATLSDPDRIVSHPRIAALFELATVIRRDLFSEYQVGHVLRSQAGSTQFRRKLDRGFKFLRAIGLIHPAAFSDLHYAHTSVVLLIMRALGLPSAHLLVPYIENPGGFVADAIVNGLDSSDAVRDSMRIEMEAALWMAAEGSVPHLERAANDVAFPRPAAVALLERLCKRHGDVASRLQGLVSCAEGGTIRRGIALPHGVPSGSSGQPGGGGGVEDRGLVMPLSWEEFVERERRKLERESAVFEAHREEWSRTHGGQFVLIRGDEVSFHATEREALDAGYRSYGDVAFLVQSIGRKEPVSVIAMRAG
jgi:hypothetical protein